MEHLFASICLFPEHSICRSSADSEAQRWKPHAAPGSRHLAWVHQNGTALVSSIDICSILQTQTLVSGNKRKQFVTPDHV